MKPPFLTGPEAERLVITALQNAPALRRNGGNFATFSPAPARYARFRVGSRLVRRMVEDGRLEWVNRCQSAAKLARVAAE